MTSLSYRPWLAPKVLNGSKPHTIRVKRKRPIRAGDLIQHFTGMRTTACKRLGESLCTGAYEITIDVKERAVFVPQGFVDQLRQDGLFPPVVSYDADDLARMDGFDSLDAFLDFFRPAAVDGPLVGDLYYWGKGFVPHQDVALSEEAKRHLRTMLGMFGPRRDWGDRNEAAFLYCSIPADLLELERAGCVVRFGGITPAPDLDQRFRATLTGMRAAGLSTDGIKRALKL